jgi:uncharacterized metal-binding protein YceD (DUF177 family)
MPTPAAGPSKPEPKIMSQTSPAPESGHSYRTAALSSRKSTRFDFRPDAGQRAALAQELGLIALPALHLKGEIRPVGRRDFELVAALTAEATQPCSVTLAPVPATIAEDVRRLFVADWTEPEGDEVEMPEDDSQEPLPEVIDLMEVAREAMALALPLYPRAPGAELGEAVFAAPGTAPIRDEDLKPFAGLASLKAKLDPGSEEK